MSRVEANRQAIHIIVALFAFFLKFFDKWQILLVAGVALVFNLLVIPHLGIKKYLFREYEQRGLMSKGFVSYALSMIILFLFFPIEIGSVAIGILGFGDGFSSMFGISYGKRKLHWNEKKSYVGFVSFVVVSFMVSLVLMVWNGFDIGLFTMVIFSFIVAFIGGIVESLAWKVDDNLSVPIVCALVLQILIIFI